MGGKCGTRVEGDSCMQSFGGKTREQETTWKT